MVFRSCAGNRFVFHHSNQWPPNSLPSKHHPSLGLSRLLCDDQKRLKINVWRAEGPLLIKATNALGKTGKQKRKWSETMEHAGSKHLMECPACWTNRLLQIERNSRRLNRAMRNISSCSFSQFPIGKSGRGGKKKTCLGCHCLVQQKLLLFICNQFWGLNYSWMPCRVREKSIFCACAPHWNK